MLDLLRLVEEVRARGDSYTKGDGWRVWDGKIILSCERRLVDTEKEVERIESALFMGFIKSTMAGFCRYCVAGFEKTPHSPIVIILYPPQTHEEDDT